MRAACGLADLARVFATLGAEHDAAVADWLGFRARRVIEVSAHVQASAAVAATPAETSRSEQLAPTPFWRVVAVEQREPIAAPARPPALSTEELSTPAEPGADSHWTPLTTRRHLATVLRRLLASPKPTLAADLRKLVRRLARAEVVTRVPRLVRSKMPERVVVVADRSRRLIPLWDDQVDVVRALARISSRGSSRVVVIQGRPTEARALRDLDGLVRSGGGTPAALLALSDLGALADAPTAASWRTVGRAARRAGSLACALSPSPTRTRSSAARSGWRVASWEPGAQASDHSRVEGVERLLRLVAVAVIAEPALLRELRRLLPRRECDVQSELELWSHRSVRGEVYGGLELTDPAEQDRLRHEFVEQETVELQRLVVDRVAEHHAERLRDLWIQEVALLSSIAAPGVVPQHHLDAAQQYFERFAPTLAPGNPDENARAALRAYFRRMARRAPRELWDDSRFGPALLDAWQLAHLDDPLATPPRRVDPARIADLVGPGESANLSLHQRAERFILEPHTPGGPPPVRASPLHALVRVGPAGARVSGSAVDASFDANRSPAIRASPAERLAITSESSALELEAFVRPAWAAAMGRDKFGLWADFEVKSVRSRLRWIPPGTFVMGASPAESSWAWTDETAHEVRLTVGFWIGETPVTQALWEAVMGENPSRFRSANRPVESVSWKDCAKFHRRLNEFVRGFDARFPTEAEWEYSCRAGTTTATYVGDLDVQGANNAPTLDGIAWYGGNSGVGAEISSAEDSSKWPEKQHEHERAATHPVRAKLPNAFGLYDMLGNVYEWSADWLGDYPTGAAIDPPGASSGGVRVLRGGAWYSSARSVRAAARRAYLPSVSFVGIGVRLARGPSELPGAERVASEAEPRSETSEQAARGRGTRPGERSRKRRSSRREER